MNNRSDLQTACALSEKPRFPPIDMPLTDAPEPITLPNGTILTPMSSLYPISPRPDDDDSDEDDLDRVISGLRNLSITLQAVRDYTVDPPENIWYSDRIYYLNRALYEIIHRPLAEGEELDAPGAMIAIVYCRNGLRDVPLRFRVIANQVTRAREALELLPAKYLRPQDPKMQTRLFWIMGLGGTAAEGLEADRAWFVREFGKLSESIGVHSWDDAKAILQNILWHPELDGPGRRFWDEAGQETRSENES